MVRKLSLLVLVLSLLILALPAAADPGKPNFGPAVWADGQVWGTKRTTDLPAVTDHNVQSYDELYIVLNSNNPAGQLAIAAAGPGNPTYNGGRWYTHTVSWTQAGFDALGTVPVLTSQAEVLSYADQGYLTVTVGSPTGGPPLYFQCPLLPVQQ